MARQYKLRLSDGTLLAVDLGGLKAWLHDHDARVQRAGSHRWHALPDMIESETLAEAMKAARPAPPPPVPPLPPAVAEEPAPVAAAEPSPLPGTNVPMLPPEVVEVMPLASIDLGDVARSVVTTPFVGFIPPRASPAAGPAADLPIIPLKPLDPEDEEARLAELDLVEEEPAGPPASPAPALEALEPVAQKVLATASTWAARIAAMKKPRLALPNRKILMGVAAAAGVAVLGSTVVWLSSSGLFARKAAVPALPAPVAKPAVEETPPPLPPELQAAAEQLPHLAAATIELVLSVLPAGPADPPEMFRRAQIAANRGATALTPDEAQELASLRRAVVGALRSADRQRVLAYDRITAGRDLMAGEDARVLRLYARGVRALPAPRRERLQELLGKAIAASLAPKAARGD